MKNSTAPMAPALCRLNPGFHCIAKSLLKKYEATALGMTAVA